MTATHAAPARVLNRSDLRRTSRPTGTAGAVPMARPVLGGPMATPTSNRLVARGSRSVASCAVVSTAARREAALLKLKVVAIGLVAVVGLGASAAEFASWAQPDPAVDYVAGDPAWAHVSGG